MKFTLRFVLLSVFLFSLFLSGKTVLTEEQNIEDYFEAFSFNNSSEIDEVKISGKTLATIDTGDFVHPKFSPDGGKIAFSKVIIEGAGDERWENTEVHLYNLQNKKTFTLLEAKKAKEYAVYASFVSDLEWLSSNRLRATISDGDVDWTALTFDTDNQKVIKTETSSDDENFDLLTNQEKADLQLLIESFPEVSKRVAESAFHARQAHQIENRGLVTQFNHVDYDTNVWFFDFQTKKKHLLFETIKEKTNFRLAGALSVNGTILYLIDEKDGTRFFTFKDEAVSNLEKTAFGGFFVPKTVSDSGAIFLLKEPYYKSGADSSLWSFDGERLRRVTDVENLSDVDINTRKGKIAFSFRAVDIKRHIIIKNLKNQRVF